MCEDITNIQRKDFVVLLQEKQKRKEKFKFTFLEGNMKISFIF